MKPETILSVAGALILLSSPALAERSAAPRIEALTDADLLARGGAELRAGRGEAALPFLIEAGARNPRDASIQSLLGLAYQRASETNPESAELALAGYDLALRVEPNQFWAAAMAGSIAYARGRYEEAERRFAQAVVARPGDGRALHALAASAYMAGDAALAATAAARAAALLQGDERAAALRLAALAEAALGESGQARAHLAVLQSFSPAAAARTEARVDQLGQTAPIDEQAPPDAPVAAEYGAPQISVDVTIILSQNTRRERIGINLLDGLQLNYGYNINRTSTRLTDAAGTVATNVQRVITEAIGFPQLTYNLNLFNRGGQYYSVVARPQLTAYLNEVSEFFVGRSLAVAVGGVNTSSLERIDIGLELKVTPVEITAEGARMRIETGRSFLTSDPAGSFSEALTTFRQRVLATAQVRFGETLLLSGLSESVDDSTFSRTPVLSSVPVLGSLFNERQRNQRRDAVLILVTPSRPARLPGRAFARPEAVARLVQLWTRVVDPGSNAADVTARLSRVRMFTRMSASDAPLMWPRGGEDAGEMLEELLVPSAH